MQRRLLVALAVALSLTVGAAGAALALDSTPTTTSTTAGPTADDRSSRTVSVSGQGEASAQPDKVQLEVAVMAEGDSTAAIRDQLASGSADLREALEDAGVADDRIETRHYRIDEQRRHPEEREGPTLRGVHVYQIELTDVDRTGTVLDAAAGSGAEVHSLRFTLSEETRDSLRDEALEQAMSDADKQASILASSADLELAGVATIDATRGDYRPVEYHPERAMAGGDGGGVATAIESGDVSVSVSVQVVYNATA